MSRHGNRAVPVRRSGQSMISLALYSAIVVVGISTVVLVGTPILEDMQDAQAFSAAKDILTGMEEQIRDVSQGGDGSQTTIGLRFAKGEFIFDADRDEVRYELDTDAQIIGPHTSRQIGNLRLSAVAETSLTESSVDNQPCWQLENDHVSICIRKIPKNTSELITQHTKGYWRFNKNQGGTAYDNASYGNDGTINGAQWTDGKQRSGVRFDGVDDYVNIGSSLSRSSGFTVSGWGKPAETGETQWIAANHDSSRGFRIGAADTGTWLFGIRNGTGDSVTVEQGTPVTGTWKHLTGVWNTTHILLYVNGNRVGTNAVTTHNQGDNNLWIGGSSQFGEYWNGTVDEVRIWNRSLSADEVQWLYEQGGKLDYIAADDLILRYYNKDEDEELNADFDVNLRTTETLPATNNGTGYVEPRLTGDGLGRGRIDAQVNTFFGIDYTIVFTLSSGSDFLQVDVEE